MKISQSEYLNAVRAKLRNPVTRTLLTFGNTKGVGPAIRDEEGLQRTFSTILKSAENLFALTDGRDDFARHVQNFSNNQGYQAVADVKTVGAIDLTILALSSSLIPFICVDRPMDMPDATLYYNNLVALNNAGGVSAGEVVSGNFTPPNRKVNLGSVFTDAVPQLPNDGSTVVIVADKEILKRSIEVVLNVEDNSGTVIKTFTGKDYNGDGQILFVPEAYGYISGAVADYTTGDGNSAQIEVITRNGVPNRITGSVRYQIDSTRTLTGENVLKVAPQWVGVTLNTQPQNIIVEDNLANRMFMAKANTVAGSKQNVNDTLFTRTKNAFIEYLNNMVLMEMIAHCNSVSQNIELDLSTYSVSDFATTKNDLITLFISNIIAKYQGITGLLPTSIITGSYGVSLLSSVPVMWQANPDVAQGINGLAGYFNGMPVYRHNRLNGGSALEVEFYMVAKLPDNSSGSMIYGEFLPLTSTGVVSNFQMPTNISNGYFAQSGVKTVMDALIIKGLVHLPAGLFTAGLA